MNHAIFVVGLESLAPQPFLEPDGVVMSSYDASRMKSTEGDEVPANPMPDADEDFVYSVNFIRISVTKLIQREFVPFNKRSNPSLSLIHTWVSARMVWIERRGRHVLQTKS